MKLDCRGDLLLRRIALAGLVGLAVGVPAAAEGGCTGWVPTPVPCNVWKCIGPQEWDLFPSPAGGSCNSGTGYCDGQGTCVYRGADIFPKFHVQSILYAPPGKQSAVSYGLGSSAGSRFQVSSTMGGGVSIQSTIVGLQVTSNYSASVTNGTATSITKSDTLVTGFSNPGTQDDPQRGHDQFHVWTNVKMTHYAGGGPPERVAWSTSNGLPVTIMQFWADELLGNQPVVDTLKAAVFGGWTLDDRNKMLSFDGPLAAGPLDPRRYQKVAHYQMSGPDTSGNPIPFGTFTTSYNTARDVTYGTSVNSSSTVLAGFELPVIGGVRAGVTYSYGYTETRSASTGEQKTAQITLRTPTPCFVMDMDVLIDAAFGTYLALPTGSRPCTAPAILTGTLTNNGMPVPNQTVSVPTANGVVGVYTNAQGVYKVYQP